MKDFVFKSSFSIEEIENNFAGMDLFSDLMDGLEEALAHSKGKATTETFVTPTAKKPMHLIQLDHSLMEKLI